MQPDLNPLADTTGIPKKKWFEGEQRSDLFFPCTVAQARNRLLHNIYHKVPEETGLWEPRSEWEVKFENDYFQIKIIVYEGRGRSNYNCFGKLIGSANGTLVQMIVRDKYISTYIPPFSIPFFACVLIIQNLNIIVFLFFFYGFIAALAVITERKAGLKKAIEVITNIISVYNQI